MTGCSFIICNGLKILFASYFLLRVTVGPHRLVIFGPMVQELQDCIWWYSGPTGLSLVVARGHGTISGGTYGHGTRHGGI